MFLESERPIEKRGFVAFHFGSEFRRRVFLGGTRVFSGGKGRREEWGFDSEFIGPNF